MKGQISTELAQQMWNDVRVHDDGIIGIGGQFVNLVGPPGTGKSTLLMQLAQFSRHLDYHDTKAALIKSGKKHVEYPETVIMRGLSDDHWNCLIPKNWKKSFPKYKNPKFLTVHIHEDDNYEFYEVSQGSKRKINHEINIKTYKTTAELFDNIRPKAINIVYEPQNYSLTPETRCRLNKYKLRGKKAIVSDEEEEEIPAPSETFWFEFLEYIHRESRGAFVTIIIDEFHNVAQPYMPGDFFFMVLWLTFNIIHMRKNNISLFISTHGENLVDYRIIERIVMKVYFRGAEPKHSMVQSSVLANLPKVGKAIIEERKIQFGIFPFDPIEDQPPLIKAVVKSAQYLQ